MIDAAIKAISQMFTRPLRTVLLKSVGLATTLLILLVILLYRVLAWLTGAGGAWIESALGPVVHGPVAVLTWLLGIALGLGLFAGALLLMPAATALVASFFCDEIAAHVEAESYPNEPRGTAVPLARAISEGVKTMLLAVFVYVLCAPFLLIAGVGAVMFFLASAYLLGREYFDLAAMRFHPIAKVKALRRANRATIFIAGMFIAAFVAIPVVNLATPLFGTAFMVHVHKRLAGA